MNVTASQLNQIYHVEGLSDPQVAQRLGVSRRTVARWRSRLGIKSKREELADRLPNTLTELQDQVVIGTLMGDGNLVCRRKDRSTARLNLAHCRAQEGYLQYKMGLLDPYTSLVHRYEERKNGKVYPMVRGYTHYHRALVPYYNLFYGGGEKTFERIWDQVGTTALAFWFFDDGSREGSGFKLVVSQKRRRDAIRASEVLREKFGFKTTYREAYGTSGVDQIRICTESADRFYYECLEPHLVPCMRHKIPPRILSDNPEPSPDGNVGEGAETSSILNPQGHGDNGHLLGAILSGSAGHPTGTECRG